MYYQTEGKRSRTEWVREQAEALAPGESVLLTYAALQQFTPPLANHVVSNVFHRMGRWHEFQRVPMGKGIKVTRVEA